MGGSPSRSAGRFCRPRTWRGTWAWRGFHVEACLGSSCTGLTSAAKAGMYGQWSSCVMPVRHAAGRLAAMQQRDARSGAARFGCVWWSWPGPGSGDPGSAPDGGLGPVCATAQACYTTASSVTASNMAPSSVDSHDASLAMVAVLDTGAVGGVAATSTAWCPDGWVDSPSDELAVDSSLGMRRLCA